MPAPRCAILFSALAACSSVAVRPDAVRADDLPERELSAEDARRAALWQEEAIDAVLRRQYPVAQERALAALDVDPRAARARAVLGMTRLQLAAAAESEPADHRELQSGEAQMQLARQLAPDDPFVGWMHAVFLAESGHMSAAADVAEGALARATTAGDQERAALLGAAGTYRYELGEERAAIPHLETYIELRPDDAAAHFRLAASLLRVAAVPQGVQYKLETAQDKAEHAAKTFLRCTELAPGDSDAALAVASALARAAELAAKRGGAGTAEADTLRQRAVEQLRTVADRFPSESEAWFRLGCLAETRGNAAEATAAYEQALARDSGHAGALLNLAAQRAATDRPAAIELWRRALQVDARNGSLTQQERRRVRALLADVGAGR